MSLTTRERPTFGKPFRQRKGSVETDLKISVENRLEVEVDSLYFEVIKACLEALPERDTVGELVRVLGDELGIPIRARDRVSCWTRSVRRSGP